MRALFYSKHGSPDVLTLGKQPRPSLDVADVLIKVAATGVNRLDIVQRNGWFTLPGFNLPHIPGMDLAGTIVDIGADVIGIDIGDRVVVDPSLHAVAGASHFVGHGDRYGQLGVIGATHNGGYGELCAASADHVHRLPEGMEFADAAVFATAWMTTYHALFRVGELAPGETVLLHGATSALTIAATQLAKAAGARVLVTATSEDKCAVAENLGASATISNGSNGNIDIAQWVREQTQGIGANMVLDHVGPALWEPSLLSLAPQGRLVSCGNTTGDSVTVPSLGFLFQRGIQIKGSDAYFSTDFAMVWEQYCTGIKQEVFNSQIQAHFAVEDGAQAHRLVESGQNLGRLVLHHAD